VSDSDEAAGRAYRQAQANRLSRFCKEFGFNLADAMAGKVDISPILDDRGKILPESIDQTETMRYFVRELPRTLFRVATGSDRVEAWSGHGWESTRLSVAQLDELGEDVYYRVHPDDAEALIVLWSG
jgi:hypothetical protein